MDRAQAKAKAKKATPWVLTLAVSLGAPTLSYLQARSEARAAEAKASQATRQSTSVQNTQGAVYELVVRELGRLDEDTDACHKRVDELATAVQALASASDGNRRNRRGMSETYGTVTSDVIQQASIPRPAKPALPKKKSDVTENDPLKGALK